jgi:simple sugar transport system permease protein
MRWPGRALAGDRDVLREVAGYVVALLLGMGAIVGFIVAMGSDVGLALRTFLESTLGNRVAFGQTLNKVSPLLLGGLAVALGLRAGCFNIGVDGQIYLGAIAATGFALSLGATAMPPVLFVSLLLLAGMAGGALLGGIPAILRAYWGVSEIFVTVMLNFVAVYLVEYLATGPWNDPMAGEAITRPIPSSAGLPILLKSAGTHGGIVLAVGAAALVWLLLKRTRLGFEIGAVGDNARAARVAGINTRRITLLALVASGAVAGLAGAIEVAGLHGRLILGLSPGYGVMAILIAVLGRNSPLGIALVSFGMAVLLVGSDSLQRSVGLPASAALVCQAIVVLTVLMLNAETRQSPQ